mmetsp:Transcript_37632/g.70328  ORF Transcript_37632/g.70328 Transcript_37632/m.70328 type:complete len:171 (+) Transcript_37632:662-1174(+)
MARSPGSLSPRANMAKFVPRVNLFSPTTLSPSCERRLLGDKLSRLRTVLLVLLDPSAARDGRIALFTRLLLASLCEFDSSWTSSGGRLPTRRGNCTAEPIGKFGIDALREFGPGAAAAAAFAAGLPRLPWPHGWLPGRLQRLQGLLLRLQGLLSWGLQGREEPGMAASRA